MILPGLPFGVFSARGINYVGGKTDPFAGTTSTRVVSLSGLSGGSDGAPRPGDLVLVFYSVAATNTSPPTLSVSTSGYQSLVQNNRAGLAYGVRLRGFYKIMSSSPDASVVVSGTGSANNAGAVTVQVFRGVDPVTPLDVADVAASAALSARANPASITPATQGAVVVACGGASHENGAVTFTASDLESFLSVGSDDVYDTTIGAGFIKWTGGAVDPAQFGFSGDNSDYAWAAYTIALRPR